MLRHEVKGATISIRAVSWRSAYLRVIISRGLLSCLPRALPCPSARGLVPAQQRGATHEPQVSPPGAKAAVGTGPSDNLREHHCPTASRGHASGILINVRASRSRIDPRPARHSGGAALHRDGLDGCHKCVG